MNSIPEDYWQLPDPMNRCVPTEVWEDQWVADRHNGSPSKRLLNQGQDIIADKSRFLDHTTVKHDEETPPSILEQELEKLAVTKAVLQAVDNPHFAVDPIWVLNILSDLSFLCSSLQVRTDLGTDVVDTYGRPGEVSDSIGNVKMIQKKVQAPPLDMERIRIDLAKVANNIRNQLGLRVLDSDLDPVDELMLAYYPEAPLDNLSSTLKGSIDSPIEQGNNLAARERMYSIRQELHRLEGEKSFLCDLLGHYKHLTENLKRKVLRLENHKTLNFSYFDRLALEYASQRESPKNIKSILYVDSDVKEIPRTRNSRKSETKNSQRTGISFD